MKTYQKIFLLSVLFIVFSFSSFAQCMNDVACYMNDWRNESNAVIFLTIPNPSGGNSKTCTGTLVNNEARNGRPYIITACHCIDTDGQSGLSQAERNNTANYIFSFRFRSSNCDGSQLDNQWQTTGAVFRMAHQASDIALIELNQQPPFDINYMGWNVSASLPANTTVIHHENSQRQKISFSNNTTAFTGNHYQVNYHSGATKGGSSGAAGFNATHQITGILSFGINGCSTIGQVLPDYYGRLSAAWLGGGTADTQLRAWLSPNQNLQSMSHLIPSLISGVEQLCAGSSTTYTLPNLIATMNATWTVSGNLTILSQNRSSVTVTPASSSSAGIGTITATVGGITSTKTIQVNLPVSNQGVTIRNTSNNTQ
ncbi:trypsin-like peptidase domain-containing protein [Thermoflexibacter ruber]|uniref:Trypsin-like peptidase domain-containing protein n=1 Tax=Thermoflexibacter ruber TaxID=1003 RepID=A0A1I2J687_9BACT|nr:trypsin-like peptidase domain-containing protein [Thermoflexibacter ruber]SFF48747.1 Trypsin-like peptidase domain-containing protein [Thermoflexibacter ruber]